MIEFRVTHTEEGLKTLYQDWWKRVHGVRNAWATGMLMFCLLVMIVLQNTDWLLVIPTLCAAGFLVLVQTLRYQATRAALNAFAAAGRPELAYRLDASGLSEASSVGTVDLAWGRFSGLTRIGRFWVLFRGPLHNAQFIAFPDHQLPPEALDLMKGKMTGQA